MSLCSRFATRERNALLLYNGRFNEKHDFIALEIIEEQIQLTFSAGEVSLELSISAWGQEILSSRLEMHFSDFIWLFAASLIYWLTLHRKQVMPGVLQIVAVCGDYTHCRRQELVNISVIKARVYDYYKRLALGWVLASKPMFA